GSGSGQQSVTGFSSSDDANSFWLLRAAFGKQCKRGEPVPCGSIIRLRHINTNGYLHSHNHKSPLSSQQEVSCYDGHDTGDDWRVECASGTKFWVREEPVQFVHVDSQAYLSCNGAHQFGHPIPGQLEVSGSKGSSKNTQWIAQVNIPILHTNSSLLKLLINTQFHSTCFHCHRRVSILLLLPTITIKKAEWTS
ncbi:MIR motif-containing protein, partial [Phycomyces nitens]